MSTTEGTTMYTVRVEAHSGNRRPWRAYVYCKGQRINATGYYASETRARVAGEDLARRHAAAAEGVPGLR